MTLVIQQQVKVFTFSVKLLNNYLKDWHKIVFCILMTLMIP